MVQRLSTLKNRIFLKGARTAPMFERPGVGGVVKGGGYPAVDGVDLGRNTLAPECRHQRLQ